MRETGHILVVDDNEANRALLQRRLAQDGHRVTVAEDGATALRFLAAQPPDLVLLDLMMPEVDGYEVLAWIKATPLLQDVPVVIISAVEELDSVARCIELGAADYLFKPFNVVLLRARVQACLEQKRLRDQERVYLRRIEAEQERAERLLQSVLPAPIIEQLKRRPGMIADNFPDATVLVATIVDFSVLAGQMPPGALVQLLNAIFGRLDQLVEQYKLEKIKTLGDTYLVMGGLVQQEQPLAAMAELALAMRYAISYFARPTGEPLRLRIGLHSGPVAAGVIGTSRISYDLWGETVSQAQRLEAGAPAGMIQVLQSTYERLHDSYQFLPHGRLADSKGDRVPTYLLLGRQPAPVGGPGDRAPVLSRFQEQGDVQDRPDAEPITERAAP